MRRTVDAPIKDSGMKTKLIDDSDNAFGPLTDEMIGESLAYREKVLLR